MFPGQFPMKDDKKMTEQKDKHGIMMVFLLSISTFVIPKLLGGGQYMLIGNLIESQFISVGDWNFGSAISLILAVLILIFMSLMKKMDKDE